MLIAIWPLIIAVVGVLIYALTSNPKLTEIGRITFFVGLFWLVYGLVGHVLHVG